MGKFFKEATPSTRVIQSGAAAIYGGIGAGVGASIGYAKLLEMPLKDRTEAKKRAYVGGGTALGTAAGAALGWKTGKDIAEIWKMFEATASKRGSGWGPGKQPGSYTTIRRPVNDDFRNVKINKKDIKTKKDADKAYRFQAVKRHPDKNLGRPEATKDFQGLNDSWATIKDSNWYGKLAFLYSPEEFIKIAKFARAKAVFSKMYIGNEAIRDAAAGAVGGAFAGLIVYPLDVLQTVQAASGKSLLKQLDFKKKTLDEKRKRLYEGMTLKLTKVIPATALTFLGTGYVARALARK